MQQLARLHELLGLMARLPIQRTYLAPEWRNSLTGERSQAAPARQDFAMSRTGQGHAVDHSGPSMLTRIVKQRKLRQREHKLLLDRNKVDPASDACVDSQWQAHDRALDGADSQMLADEAMREFELRRTVGLITEEIAASQPPPPSQLVLRGGHKTSQQQQIQDAWTAMEEVPLEAMTPRAHAYASSDSPALVTPPTIPSLPLVPITLLDVGTEVQRVRKSLHQRRRQRTERTERVQNSSKAPKAWPSAPPVPTLDRILQAAPAASPSVTPEISPAPAAPAVPAMPAMPAMPAETVAFEAAALHFPPSQRGLSECEVRVALAQEFIRFGQTEEAAMLCEEVLRHGNASDQRNARKLLALPGR